ncbi:MAG: DUF1028 domain-containing protein [Alphaproteobacteria bacterium]|jgi:uncharacterized Ntn-hydrolase superfamily protein|nr:DUF1028 domain-containing protein [Alphaproteobacteria bacterium]MDP6567668.1 DUF1028 domain-containing protein [Alphaproteobacteria bacterium]MDP6813196.1 DUF1028 domain-containing protein [Alphaproteobacteria bacterium]
MTWSIVALDRDAGTFGVAAASRFLAVGALVPWLRGGVGAVATQAMVNPMFGPMVLDALAAGQDVEKATAAALATDAGAASRQLHAIDAAGRHAAWTGGDCIPWCGHRTGEDISVAGNMLVGEGVLTACLERFQAGAALPFAERLLAALLAGDQAGGDKRGRQSAVLRVHGREVYPDLDIRVDDHPDAPNELARVYTVSQEDFAIYRDFLPTRANPAGITDRAKLEAARAARKPG